MYTGLIDHIGKVIQLTKNANTLRLWIETQFTDLEIGESIAADGICVTVIDPQPHLFVCDISPETYRLTTTKYYQHNQLINLERSLCLSDRLGGHVVMGHGDKTCSVKTVTVQDECKSMIFSGLTSDDQKYLIKKGCVAVNGVSLTINEVFLDGFEVMLIPHTLERTNLAFLQMGDHVNIEFDYIARIVLNK